MAEVLEDIHRTGQTPDKYISKEELNKIGPDHVTKEDIEGARELIKQSQLESKYQFVFVDGIMLYHADSPVAEKFDLRFFLRASYEELKKRRAARTGYVTLEGFWQDPPGYFDEIVWPSYVEYHKYLFENADVDSRLLSSAAQGLDIYLPSPDTSDMAETLQWAVNVLIQTV